MSNDAQKQSEYYTRTADGYEKSHIEHGLIDEHDKALSFLSSFIRLYNIKSILDVGSGTGRALDFFRDNHPDVKIIGIEPVEALRKQGHAKGIPESLLIDGDGNKIDFKTGEFDLVCEFGVLHHVKHPEVMIAEMLRVSSKAIFISDSNNFGQGSVITKLIKQTLNALGLWKAYDFLSTKGKGYHFSDGDGLFYSYSVFNNYEQIKKASSAIHFFNTVNASHNLYRSSSHIALLAFKKV